MTELTSQPAQTMWPEYRAGWCARSGGRISAESREYLEEAASFSWVHGVRDLEREPACETLGGTFDRVLASVGGQGFLSLHAQMEGAVTAGPAHCLLWCNSAIYPHLAGTDAGLGVAEDVALSGEMG